MHCQKCGHILPDDAAFCDSCGENTGKNAESTQNLTQQQPISSTSKVFCSNCGSEVEKNSTFCTKCGKALNTIVKQNNNGYNLLKDYINGDKELSGFSLGTLILSALTSPLLYIMHSIFTITERVVVGNYKTVTAVPLELRAVFLMFLLTSVVLQIFGFTMTNSTAKVTKIIVTIIGIVLIIFNLLVGFACVNTY